MLDLQYHDIRSNKGLYYKLEKHGLVERILNDQQIERALIDPHRIPEPNSGVIS
jgi:proteasome accessory factor A